MYSIARHKFCALFFITSAHSSYLWLVFFYLFEKIWNFQLARTLYVMHWSKSKKKYTKLLRMFISWIPITLGVPQRVCPLEDIKCLISAGLILSICLNEDIRSFSSYTDKSNAVIQWSNDRFNSNSNLFLSKCLKSHIFIFIVNTHLS